jgi:hypothetical protein
MQSLASNFSYIKFGETNGNGKVEVRRHEQVQFGNKVKLNKLHRALDASILLDRDLPQTPSSVSRYFRKAR